MELVWHYLWKSRLFGLKPTLDSGERLDVIDPGLSNPDAGPDFFNSKIRIDGTEWVGNVELHERASDWYRHNHQNDPLYDSVILHVVGHSDREVRRTDNSLIPQIELPVPDGFYMTYKELKSGLSSIRCGAGLSSLSRLTTADWIQSLGVERLQAKSRRILDSLERAGGDWNTAAFITLARGLGFGINAEPFEILARSLPLNFLLRHSDNIFQLEALLFGQAGLIPAEGGDDYTMKLRAEYRFLAAKYGLSPIPENIWRFARTRPRNFPERRIAFLATALAGSFPLPGLLKAYAASPDLLRNLFGSWRLTGYWSDHYTFGLPAPKSAPSLSKPSIDLLLINVAAPYIYASASRVADVEAGEKALDILYQLKPEKNSIIAKWGDFGLTPDNAMESQALIQLRREYCDRSQCLRCRFAAALLRREINPPRPFTVKSRPVSVKEPQP